MSVTIKTDVTAVKLLDNGILAGIGSFIHLFSKDTGKLLQRCRVLLGHRIHGFRPWVAESKTQILVFGGKQFSIVSVDNVEAIQLNVLSDAIICDDWILDMTWNTQASDNTVVLLTAHNVIQKWNMETKTLVSSHHRIDNSILYSGLLVPLNDDLMIFSGTVYSEVLISFIGNENAVHRLKGHKGVILSIACDLHNSVIVTTSDDRSVRIWGPTHPIEPSESTKTFWQTIQIECKYKLYGHTARVMRCAINNDIIATVGEDSHICLWSKDGRLMKKKSTHQNGCIWSIDIDKNNNIITGGGDSGVILHPKSLVNFKNEIKALTLNVAGKKILYTARNNVVILTKDKILYYDDELKEVTGIYEINFESTYILMSLSSCKQLISVIDMLGNFILYIENCKGEPCLKSILNTKLDFGKVMSMQWAGNRHIILCCEGGDIKVLTANGNQIEEYASLILPNCKERWLTSSAINNLQNIFVVGDRCGNIHIYSKEEKNPIKTFNKVHGRYGPTSISIKYNEIKTTGRDGTIKHFNFDPSNNVAKYMCSKDLTFEWVEKFLDRNEKYICGFRERVFAVYDIENDYEILEVACGGGHRTWDAVRYIEKTNNSYQEHIKIIYLKSPELYEIRFNLDDITPKHFIVGSHTKEINCLDVINCDQDFTRYIFISGGEDTTLRATIGSSKSTSTDDVTEKVIYKHLSNIRTLKTKAISENRFLVVTGGGRAQICVNIINIHNNDSENIMKTEEVSNYMIKGTDKQRKGNKSWKECTVDFDPETRIMDLDIHMINENIYNVYAGCSDACLRVFQLNLQAEKNETFKATKDIKHHKTCILKVYILKHNLDHILLTCTTRGIVSFWDIDHISNDLIDSKTPFFETQTNKSGINSIDIKTITGNSIILATGGDDNAIYISKINIMKEQTELKCEIVSCKSIDRWHSSQITGLRFVNGSLLLSASIDQRITLCRWSVENEKMDCEFLEQTFSDIADIQGLKIVNNLIDTVQVCVFGKGYEVLNISKNNGVL